MEDRADDELSLTPIGKVGVTVCGAQLRGRPGVYCQKPPLKGRTRCRLHGGLVPRGDALPQYKHGLYSKALPKNLRDEFKRLVNDPELLSARAEVALLQIRLKQLASRVGSNSSIEGWKRLRDTFAEFRAANAAGDAPRMLEALNTIQQTIDGAVADDEAWSDLVEAVERATAVGAREWRRLADNQQMATYDQVRLIVMSIAEAVMLHVKDQTARAAIAEHIGRLRIIEPIALDSE